MAIQKFSRCSICNKPFRRSKGASVKQRICSAPGCRREAHRRACTRWHKQHPNYDRETRLAKRLVRKTTLAEWLREPMAAIDWAQARDDVGLATAVLVEEWAKVFLAWARETVRLQIAEAKRLSAEQPLHTARERVSAKLE